MIDRDVESRMDAYRSNPQALAQKYAVGQELLDLIALQKLKSEKEAAMRNMQLQMSQQGKPTTIAKRREAEVLGMTKDEILQQQGGIMKQKQDAQQKALEEMAAQRNPAAGIPTLPTPEVMPEAAMAAGGIVAFAAGGTAWEKKKTPYDQLIEAEARRRGIDPIVFKRLLGSESSFKETAVSPRGEKYGIGIAQIADVHGMSKEDRLNPSKAIPAAAEIFAQYLKRADGDYERALQMYKGASSEGGKKRMAGPIQRILEGVTDVLIPTAKAGETTSTQPGQPVTRGVTPKTDRPKTARERLMEQQVMDEYGIGPQTLTPEQQKASEDSARQATERVRLQKQLEGLTGGFFNQKPMNEAQAAQAAQIQQQLEAKNLPTPPVVDSNKAQPTGRIGAFNVPEDQFPLMGDQEMMARRQIGVGSADMPPTPAPAPETPPAPAPAPAPAPPSGLASILPPEYVDLATQQNKALTGQLKTDPEAIARQRAQEYQDKYGKEVETAAAASGARLEDRLRRQAEIREAEKSRSLTDALLGAQGATWQEALGSAGRAGLASIRRGETKELELLEAEEVARTGLANVGLAAKKGGLDALTAGRTEGIGALQKGTTEAGLAIGRATQAATQLETSRTAAEYNRLYHQAQIDAKNAATEIDRKQGIEANRNRARMLLASDKRTIEKLEEAANLSLLNNKQPPEALVKEIAAKKKELDLKELDIATKYDALLYNTGTGTGAGLPPGIKSITPVSR